VDFLTTLSRTTPKPQPIMNVSSRPGCRTGRKPLTDRETADEYGWRNFGDTWANNETDQSGGPHDGRDVISHFNLEYDFGYGMLFQSLRTLGGAPELSRKWWDLAEAALRHEADIDVFHNMDDPFNRGVYDGGKFTHTAHGVEAALSTHRGAPNMTWFGSLRWPWGEGSSPESGHFNTRGQICYYYSPGPAACSSPRSSRPSWCTARSRKTGSPDR